MADTGRCLTTGQLRIALVGTGALGSAVCRLLAEAGVEHVLLIDPDEVEPRNLPLSEMLRAAQAHGHGSSETTSAKAVLIAQYVRDVYGLPWQALAQPVADVGWQELAACDVLLCCTDSALSRVETAYAARMLRLPMLEAGVQGEGIAASRVAWFAPAVDAACYLCGMTEVSRAEALTYATATSLGCQPSAAAEAMTASIDVLHATAAKLVQQAAELAAGRLSQNRSSAIRLSRRANAGWHSEEVLLTRSATCPWHEAQSLLLTALSPDIPIDKLLRTYPSGTVLQLPWPVCVEARCSQCDHRWQPNCRVALVRAGLQCPACGVHAEGEVLRALHVLHTESEEAILTLQQLGQPDRHLYLVRPPISVQEQTGEVA